jgi:hypothetical protein
MQIAGHHVISKATHVRRIARRRAAGASKATRTDTNATTSQMKIVKKATVIETIDGGTVRQSAWQPMANALVQCEFEAEYPSHLSLAPVFGALGIFLSSKVERIRFSLAPRNISQPGAPAYDQMALNCLEFKGGFLGGELNVRTHKRLASVTSDGGFAYVQFGCGHVACKREDDRIVLVAGPDCQLAVSGGFDTVTVAVSSKKDEKH